MFNVTYWPYVQDSSVYECVLTIFADSFNNLSLLESIMGLSFELVVPSIITYFVVFW